MGITFTSLIMAILTAFLLLMLVQFILLHPAYSAKIHPDILFQLLTLAFFRLLFPFNWLSAHVLLPELDAWVNHFFVDPWLFGWNGYCCLSLIWLTGILVQLHSWHQKERLARHYLSLARSQGTQRCYTDYIPDWKGPNYPVYITSLFPSPVIIAQGRSILLPPKTYTPEAMEYILRHEAEHLYNYDGTLIECFNLLKSLYWWLPVFSWISSLFVLFTESRVDYQVTKTCSPLQTLTYCESLVLVARKVEQPARLEPVPLLHLIPDNDAILSLRLQILMERIKQSPSSASLQQSLLLFGAGLFLLLELLI